MGGGARALIHNRHTDAGIYFRAAWAIRVGASPYWVADDNGWHYMYPPLLAVFLTPLADASAGMPRAGLLPYAVSITIWYVLSVGLLFAAAKMIADAVSEKVAPEKSTPWRRWLLIVWPILICLPVICRGLIRGQVGPLWLWLTCGMLVGLMRGKNFRSGLWLAAAICLKLIPGFLLIYPLWRRNTRMLFGCAIGMVLGFVVIPWLAMGSANWRQSNDDFFRTMVLPAIGIGREPMLLRHEMLDPRTSDTESFVSILMKIGAHLGGLAASYHPPRYATIGSAILAISLTAITLWAVGWRKESRPIDDALGLALLTIVMLPIGPVCHPHYFLLLLPTITILLAILSAAKPTIEVPWRWFALLILIPVSHVITSLPNSDLLRDCGLVVWVALALWAAGIAVLRLSITIDGE